MFSKKDSGDTIGNIFVLVWHLTSLLIGAMHYTRTIVGTDPNANSSRDGEENSAV